MHYSIRPDVGYTNISLRAKLDGAFIVAYKCAEFYYRLLMANQFHHGIKLLQQFLLSFHWKIINYYHRRYVIAVIAVFVAPWNIYHTTGGNSWGDIAEKKNSHTNNKGWQFFKVFGQSVGQKRLFIQNFFQDRFIYFWTSFFNEIKHVLRSYDIFLYRKY